MQHFSAGFSIKANVLVHSVYKIPILFFLNEGKMTKSRKPAMMFMFFKPELTPARKQWANDNIVSLLECWLLFRKQSDHTMAVMFTLQIN